LRVTVLTGPTAGGKSALALALAGRLNGVIINADASQLYAALRVVTARPSCADESAVPHRLYGVLAGEDACTAARWAEMAKAEIAAARATGLHPIVVGGAGLYLAALVHGLAPVPEIDPGVRAAVRALPTDAARAALEREDPASAARLMPADRQRTLRALEVVREQFFFRRGALLDLLKAQEELFLAGRELIQGMVEQGLARFRLLHVSGELDALLEPALVSASPTSAKP